MFPEDSAQHDFPRQVLFENPELTGKKKTVPEFRGSMFRYFLDGSQRSHRVLDASINGRYLPICAGQIGVSVLERTDAGKLRPMRSLTSIENLLVFPNLLSSDNIEDLTRSINEQLGGRHRFRILTYDVDKEGDKDPGDLGRAIIIFEMQRKELQTIRQMIEERLIGPNSWLAKDGGLQYGDTKIRDLNLGKDDVVQLRHVIGLAKSFRPSLTLGQGRKREDLGNIIKGLNWKERSTVICPVKDSTSLHGWWYLRMRPREKVYSPLQGIIKLEVFAVDSLERESGIAESRADTVSSSVLAERNVTPYQSDPRWASHIYPISMTESYLRASFLSHERFKALIF